MDFSGLFDEIDKLYNENHSQRAKRYARCLGVSFSGHFSFIKRMLLNRPTAALAGGTSR